MASFYIIDGHGYSYQAFFAVTMLNAVDGTPTNAIYGFHKLLTKILQKKPTYIIVCFDTPSPTFRQDIYEDYKANRKPMPDEMRLQMPIIKELLAAYNISIFEKEGFECDDLMATIATQVEKQGHEAFLVTLDKDMQQLVTEKIKIYNTKKMQVFGIQEVIENFGLPPHVLPDYFGLVGDSVDNIPGVKGIGPKKALGLLQQWSSLDEIYKNIDAVKPARTKKLLLEQKDMAYTSKELFILDKEVEIDFSLEKCLYRGPDEEKLGLLFQRLGFRTLLKQRPRKTYIIKGQYINDENSLNQLIPSLERAKYVAIELETKKTGVWNTAIESISLSWEKDQVVYIPMKDGINLKSLEFFWQSDIPKVAHDLKKLYRVLYAHGILLNHLKFDTMLAAYLLSPMQREFSLNDLSSQYLGVPCIQENVEPVCYYPTRACLVYKLVEKLQAWLKENQLDSLLEEIEIPLIPVLAEMELSGISLDETILKSLSCKLHEKLKDLEEKIYSFADGPFNIASSQQLATLLFEKLNLPTGKKTKTGYSTNSDVLQTLVNLHPLPNLVIDYRQISKLLNTYIDVFPSLIRERTKRIHTLFNQTGTATGRISSFEPNLQNIPIRTEDGKQIRKAFISAPGEVLIMADYSQIELRVLAHFSQDPKLIEAFENDLDIHACVAAKIFDLEEKKVTSKERRIAKAVNFGIIYGQTPFGLAKELNISTKEAKKFIENYFETYSRVREFLDEVIAEAHNKRFVETICKRRRYLPDINSSKHHIKQFAERTAVNTIMQGSAADIIKKAMIAIYSKRNEEMLPFKILLQIHDELIVEAPEEMAEETAKVLSEQMQKKILRVPLKVKITTAKSWLG